MAPVKTKEEKEQSAKERARRAAAKAERRAKRATERKVLPVEMPMLIDETAVAGIIGVSPDTVRSWRSKGRRQGPRFLKLSARVVRYRVEAVQEYLAELERASKAG